MVEVILQKRRITPAHGRLNRIRQVAQICTSPSNTCFLGPTRVHIPNGISIGSAVFARLTIVTDRQTDRQTSRWVFTARLRPQFGMPRSFDRCTPPRRRFNQNIPSSVMLLQQCHCRNRHSGKLQNVSPPSVLFESSPIFLQYTGDHRLKKRLEQNFEMRML